VGLGIKKNDTVQVIAGDERGKTGRVIAVHKGRNRLLVERLNMIKKHMKPNKNQTQGGIIEKEGPIHMSNIMLVCSKCNKATRINHNVLENGKKIRACKKCGEVIE